MTNFYQNKPTDKILRYLEIAAGKTFLSGTLSDARRACVEGALDALKERTGPEDAGRYDAAIGIDWAEKILSLN